MDEPTRAASGDPVAGGLGAAASDGLGAAAMIEEVVAEATLDPELRSAAVARVLPEEVEAVIHGTVPRAGTAGAGHDAGQQDDVLGRGSGVSPGVGTGSVCRSSEEALDAWDAGDEVVLVVAETRPVDEPAMRICAAIVTERGGPASHAAVVARDLGVPAVCGTGPLDVASGQMVTVDGSAGVVLRSDLDPPAVAAARRAPRGAIGTPALPPALATLLGWADDIAASRMRVLANADRGESAALARAFGARGVGLCRVEHVFLGPDAALVAAVLDGRDGALGPFSAHLASTLVEVFDAFDGLPVTVRLLDAPAHEFGGPVEHDPMLGLRGVRAALRSPALLRAQVTAVLEASAARTAAGGDPRPRLLLPMVAHSGEVAHARDLITELAPGLEVGAMIETPRAALTAASIAPHADFLSFGTNDLTQLTWGWSRDDLDARLLPVYEEMGIVGVNPFLRLDLDGVGRLVAAAVSAARSAIPGIPAGVCGEHGGDPGSVAALLVLGIDSVSCSPYRVPVARLAAAHAVLASAGDGM